MSLDNQTIRRFAKMIKEQSQTTDNQTIAYGTAVQTSDGYYVRLDGSGIEMPVATLVGYKPNDRVTVVIKDHQAVIIGNSTNPSMIDLDNMLNDGSLAATLAKIDQAYINGAQIEQASISYANINNAFISDLISDNGNFKTLYSEILKVEHLSAKVAEISDLKADDAFIVNLSSLFISTDKINAVSADIEKAVIESLDTKYANIDFANIDLAAIQQFYATSGIIKDLVIEDESITGELVGVTIRGDLIEANTIAADKLVIKGEDGLYYKLNTDGITIEAEQTDYNSLNGSVIRAKSVTADKIAVTDLVAFNATIAGFHITESALFSGVKTSAINTTRGIYFGKDGQVGIGDSDNYIKYYKDQNGNFKLAVSAGSVEFSTGKSVEEAFNEVKSVDTTVVTYQVGTSGTVPPTGTWSVGIPTVKTNQYLWTRTVITYTDGSDVTLYSVSSMGATGPQGEKGETGATGATGATGKSIGSVTNYYLATNSSSGVATSTSGWTTSVQSVSASKKYLWNYEVIKYTDGTIASTTTPCIIGAYGDTGSTGATGATGNGILSIAEKYAVSSSNSTAPTTWYDAVQTMTATNKYLWNYEIITYTNGTKKETSKRVIGVYGEKGATGDTGNGVKSSEVTYQASTSGTTVPTGTWSSSVPSVSAGSFLWTRTIITYTNGTSTTSYSVSKMGNTGATGATGATGPQGLPGIDFSQGKMLYTDPMFILGVNYTSRYNNANNGTVTVTRTSKSSDNPMTSTSYELVISNTGTASPGLGGFYFGTQSRANAIFVYRIVAKIPTGYDIGFASNAYGNGGKIQWLTSQSGTGKFSEYIARVECGGTGSFSTTGFFYIVGGSNGTSSSPVKWYVAYATCFDMTNARDIDSKVTQGDVVNQVNSELKIDGKSISLTTGHFTISSKNFTLDSAGNATFSGDIKGAKGEFTRGFDVSIPITNSSTGFKIASQMTVDTDGSISIYTSSMLINGSTDSIVSNITINTSDIDISSLHYTSGSDTITEVTKWGTVSINSGYRTYIFSGGKIFIECGREQNSSIGSGIEIKNLYNNGSTLSVSGMKVVANNSLDISGDLNVNYGRARLNAGCTISNGDLIANHYRTYLNAGCNISGGCNIYGGLSVDGTNLIGGNNQIYSMQWGNSEHSYIHTNTNAGAYGINVWYSDSRLKKNINTTEVSGLDFVNRIRHVCFEWTNPIRGLKPNKIGYLADQLQELDPDTVIEVKQPDGSEFDTILQINETKLIPYLSKAIQEQYDIIYQLEKRIMSLEKNLSCT